MTKSGPGQEQGGEEESTLEMALGWMRMKKQDVELLCFCRDSANHQCGGTQENGQAQAKQWVPCAQVEHKALGALWAVTFSR